MGLGRRTASSIAAGIAALASALEVVVDVEVGGEVEVDVKVGAGSDNEEHAAAFSKRTTTRAAPRRFRVALSENLGATRIRAS